jgi:hypothetical protein
MLNKGDPMATAALKLKRFDHFHTSIPAACGPVRR